MYSSKEIKNMKKKINIFCKAFIVPILLLLASSCNDLLDVDSDQYFTEGENQLNSPNDSTYSVTGALAQMQKVAQSYFVLGEVRADLTDVTENADRFLREINAHEAISAENPYVDVAPYYALINNCNYAISRMDTLIKNKALLPDYMMLMKIRAWTYFQLAKNYSKVLYYEEPVLDVADARKVTGEYLTLQQLLTDKLIPQMQFALGSSTTSLNPRLIPSAEFLLGEFYLWLGDYEQSAFYYKKTMEKETGSYNINNGEIQKIVGFICDATFRNQVFDGMEGYSLNWNSIFSGGGSHETGCFIIYASFGTASPMYEMCFENVSVKASSHAIDKWYNQVYESQNIREEFRAVGDFRGNYIHTYVEDNALAYRPVGSWGPSQYYKSASAVVPANTPCINKYYTTNGSGCILLERAGLLHLRYAEAINRLGKPSLALAAINYGLKRATVSNPKYVNQQEIADGSYLVNFNHTLYDNNLGVRGRVHMAPQQFPATLNTLQDSILFVEEVIVEELALETAFEGNRWGDLVRIALRRNDPSFLANTVAAKFESTGQSRIPSTPTADAAQVRARLSDSRNFFIPFPEK